jgi:Tol biopolymer transport system component
MADGGDRTFQRIPNPYIVGNPIEDRQMFFGREDDFGYIKTKVTGNRQGTMIVLGGTRRSGKTSIFFQIMQGRLGPDFLPVLIDMQLLNVSSDTEFVKHLARRMLAVADRKDGEITFDSDSDDYSAVSQAFLAMLKRLANSLHDRSIVLMFDEYEIFETNIDDEARNAEYWSSSIGKSLHRRISFLSRSDAMRLIHEPVRGLVQYKSGVPESIIELTAGQPFYTQCICQSLVDLLNEQEKSEAGAHDIQQVVQGIVDNPLPHMVFTFDQLNDVEKIAIASLAQLNRQQNSLRSAGNILDFLAANRTGITLEDDMLREALERLFQNDLLGKEEDGEHFRFKMDLWRQWILRMHSIWQVLDEVFKDGRSPDEGVIRIARRRLVRMLWFLAATAVLVATVVAIFQIVSRPRTGPVGEDVWDLTYTPLTGDGKTYGGSISADGKQFVYVHNDNGAFGLRLKQIETGIESLLVRAERKRIRSPVFSPDGSKVFYTVYEPGYTTDEFADYDLMQVNVADATVQRIKTGVMGRRIACSAEGGRLAFMQAKGDTVHTLVSDIDGSHERSITSHRRDLTVRRCLAWSGDGQEIFTTERDSASGHQTILTLSVHDGSSRHMSEVPWQAILDLCALSDDLGLLVVGMPAAAGKDLNSNLWLLTPDSDTPRQLTNDMANHYQVSADQGALNFALSSYAHKRTLRVLALDSPADYKDLSTDVVANGRVIWSTSGRLLASQRMGNRIGLVYMNSDGSGVEPVVTDVDYVAGMAVSPVDQRIVYTSFQGKDLSIWQVGDEGGPPRRLTADEGNARFPEFSPDGRWMFYSHQTAAGEPYFLMRMSVADGMVTRLSDVPGIEPKVSPDGKTIAANFQDRETGKYRLGLIPAEGGQPSYPDIDPAANILCWNRDGSGFTCFKRDGSTLNVWNYPLSGEPPSQLVSIPAGPVNVTDLSWNAEGDSLVASLEIVAFDAVLLQRSNP